MKSLICLVFSLGAIQAGCQEKLFSIHGHVLDSHGASVGLAHIEALPPPSAGVPRILEVFSADDGSFKIPNLPAGRTFLFVSKEELGVPSSRQTVFEPLLSRMAAVDLGPKTAAITDVLLTLPPPFGLLYGRVADAQTGAAVETFTITIRRFEQPSIYLSRSSKGHGQYRCLLPERPMEVTISADGYRDHLLVFRDSETSGLTLKSGERISLDVSLSKVDTPPIK